MCCHFFHFLFTKYRLWNHFCLLLHLTKGRICKSTLSDVSLPAIFCFFQLKSGSNMLRSMIRRWIKAYITSTVLSNIVRCKPLVGKCTEPLPNRAISISTKVSWQYSDLAESRIFTYPIRQPRWRRSEIRLSRVSACCRSWNYEAQRNGHQKLYGNERHCRLK
jgi:hypothetical protein